MNKKQLAFFAVILFCILSVCFHSAGLVGDRLQEYEGHGFNLILLIGWRYFLMAGFISALLAVEVGEATDQRDGSRVVAVIYLIMIILVTAVNFLVMAFTLLGCAVRNFT